MPLTAESILNCASEYGLPRDDALLIALNIHGLDMTHPLARLRYHLHLPSQPTDPFLVVTSGQRANSPFSIHDGLLMLTNEPWATVTSLENDDCLPYYFRAGNTVLVLNSNSRSRCVGCAFCHSSLQDHSDPKATLRRDLEQVARRVAETNGSLDGLRQLTVCTGCFGTERRALDHLHLVRSVFADHGFCGQMNFLSSVIHSPEAFDEIAATLSPFYILFTIECFEHRAQVLRPSKARFSVDDFERACMLAHERGIAVGMTYLVGLDDLSAMLNEMARFAPLLTAFPMLNLFQAHNAEMDELRHRSADHLDYYARVRVAMEDLFSSMEIRPRPWECYRSLWYTTFQGRILPGPRL